MLGRSPFLVLLLTVALSTPVVAAQRAATEELVWPAPPEQPRIRYVGSLSSEADLGKREGFLRRIGRALTGGSRDGDYTLTRPLDVYVDGGQRYYFTDGVTPAVVLFEVEKRAARFLGEDVPGGFAKPMGIAGDGQGLIYVADQSARRVVVLDAEGTFLRAFGGADLLLNPIDVAVDRDADRYYVVDSYLHQVVVFDGAGSVVQRLGRTEGTAADKLAHRQTTGEVTSAFQHDGVYQTRDVVPNRGGADGEFRYPGFAAVGADGTLYVTDQMNFRVQIFDRDGRFVRTFGRAGDVPGTFARPKGIAVDREGHIFVVDAAFNNVQAFDTEGRLLMAFGSIGHGEGQHWLPLGIAIDDADRIYVVDRYNNRAQIYQFLGAPEIDPDADSTDVMQPVDSGGRGR